ncbi:MAG: KTSC domain-containing protein [Bacteroidales bacterium]|nr:KTSC domain-containing protein [Bacteroidales bacterium]
MDRKYVSSSNIASIGYDSISQILEVEFLNGAIYQYYDVPETLYDGLMSADSHGKYLNEYIKKGGYSYSRV